MWYFQSVNDPGKRFIILPGKDYVVGRQNCHILIENDQSVSRKHATIHVTYPENCKGASQTPLLIYTDTSMFGTTINEVKINKQQKRLQHGDVLKFGMPTSTHTIIYEPLVVTMSCLDASGKKEVRSIISQLGGVITNDWRKDCSFVIMKSVTVTIKVVCALVSQKHIVTIAYLQELSKHLQQYSYPKPDPEKFLPGVSDSLSKPDISFRPSADRSSVFLGMTFYFLSQKQFEKLNLAVELGGGLPMLTESPEDVELEQFLVDKTVVMEPNEADVADEKQQKWVEKVCLYFLL